MPSEKYNPAEAKLRFSQQVIEQIARIKLSQQYFHTKKNLKLQVITDFDLSLPLTSHFY